jgi:hypothetical protein
MPSEIQGGSMTLPVIHRPDWCPLTRYSVIEFGADVRDYEHDVLTPQDGHDPAARPEVWARYWSEDLDCDVYALGGLVHEILPLGSCHYKGLNIVGSNIEAVLSLLDVRTAEWHLPYPTEPLERIAVIIGLGVQLWVPNASQTVCHVTLRSKVDDHRAREYLARRQFGDLFESLRPRAEFVPPEYKIETLKFGSPANDR